MVLAAFKKMTIPGLSIYLTEVALSPYIKPMINLQSTDGPQQFEEVSHQGKTIRLGDTVLVNHKGQSKEVVVSSLTERQGHYWVGYDEDTHSCPWPLARPINTK